jgi:hypothetical protein
VNVAESPLILELLAWIARSPRTYNETMEAWRTSCPRHSVWEDAWISGLVNVVAGDARNEPAVILTERGKFVLDEQGKPGQNGPVNH